MLRIESDRRHSNIARLSDRPVDARLFAGWGMARPDPTPLGDQAFRIITEDGSGAQVTGLLLKLSEAPTGMFV